MQTLINIHSVEQKEDANETYAHYATNEQRAHAYVVHVR